MADLVRIEGEIARLRDISLEELRVQWQRQMRTPAPACFKSDLLFRTLAYQLQVKALGGLDRATERLLDRLAEAEDPTGGAGVAPPAPDQARHRTHPGVGRHRSSRGRRRGRVRLCRTDLHEPLRDRTPDHRHELEWTALLRPAAAKTSRRPRHCPQR